MRVQQTLYSNQNRSTNTKAKQRSFESKPENIVLKFEVRHCYHKKTILCEKDNGN